MGEAVWEVRCRSESYVTSQHEMKPDFGNWTNNKKIKGTKAQRRGKLTAECYGRFKLKFAGNSVTAYAMDTALRKMNRFAETWLNTLMIGKTRWRLNNLSRSEMGTRFFKPCKKWSGRWLLGTLTNYKAFAVLWHFFKNLQREEALVVRWTCCLTKPDENAPKENWNNITMTVVQNYNKI